jgi:NADPH-dependent glutamate synthase beta subunit-like oxidoreductase
MSASKYLVAIFGGAVSGSEAAFQLAERGIPSVVFDQNPLPYGKIEDGLPKWHVKLRDKEIQRINEKLNHPLVTFVPSTKLGKDIQFEDLMKMGFSAVLLATGAWKDRPLGIDGIDDYVGKGLVYQNPFIYWFNHMHEPGFEGEAYTIEDGAGIIGGGLASLDVAKVLMFELVQKALKERGHEIDLFALDRSIAKVLDEKGLTLEDLGIKGCTLFYRRRIKDMPLSPGDPTTPEEVAKAEAVREKILNNYRSKYLFNVAANHVPVDKIVENDRLVGLIFQETEVINGKVKAIPGSEKEIRFPYVISSIGSLPDIISGIPSCGTTYEIEDEIFCRLSCYPNVFALGNAVTGRGNIKESLDHGREISQNVIEGYLANAEGDPNPAVLDRIASALEKLELEIREHKVNPATFQSIMTQVKTFQDKVGYDNDYLAWVQKHLPERLENQLGSAH